MDAAKRKESRRGAGRGAHGVLPVPAPATAYLLRDVPIYGGAIQGELCTPTGAALLRHFVTRFGDMPVMTLESVGYGMGQKEFPRANCLRAMLGETAAESGDVVELKMSSSKTRLVRVTGRSFYDILSQKLGGAKA